MRYVLLSAISLALCSASAGAQQTGTTAPDKKDTTQLLGTVKISASASGQGEARTVNALGKRELQER